MNVIDRVKKSIRTAAPAASAEDPETPHSEVHKLIDRRKAAGVAAQNAAITMVEKIREVETLGFQLFDLTRPSAQIFDVKMARADVASHMRFYLGKIGYGPAALGGTEVKDFAEAVAEANEMLLQAVAASTGHA